MKKPITINNKTKSLIIESFKALRTNINFLSVDKKVRSIVITSARPLEGKSTIAINLANIIARTQKQVLLIDGDLRKPTIHKYTNLMNKKGFTNVLMGNLDESEAIQFIKNLDNLSILTSGPIPPNPSELLQSNRMEELVKKMYEKYDMIIFDSPPIELVTDATILSTKVDGTILVCKAGKTKVEDLKKAKDLLVNVNANILGVIINKVSFNKKRYSKYNYYNYLSLEEE